VDGRKIAREYRQEMWSSIVRERIECGLNIRAFCERKGICENTYYYWQRKLRETAAYGMQIAKNETALNDGGWVTAIAKDELRSIAIEIGKYRIIVSEETSEELLVKICKALGMLC
jgi:putative transposase